MNSATARCCGLRPGSVTRQRRSRPRRKQDAWRSAYGQCPSAPCTGGCRIIAHDFAQTRREILATSWLHRRSVWLWHAVVLWLPKPKVAGSRPVARFVEPFSAKRFAELAGCFFRAEPRCTTKRPPAEPLARILGPYWGHLTVLSAAESQRPWMGRADAHPSCRHGALRLRRQGELLAG
jgi:hypothetical protein